MDNAVFDVFSEEVRKEIVEKFSDDSRECLSRWLRHPENWEESARIDFLDISNIVLKCGAAPYPPDYINRNSQGQRKFIKEYFKHRPFISVEKYLTDSRPEDRGFRRKNYFLMIAAPDKLKELDDVVNRINTCFDPKTHFRLLNKFMYLCHPSGGENQSIEGEEYRASLA